MLFRSDVSLMASRLRGGWIKLWRKIREHPFYTERKVFSKLEAWLDLLLTANHQDHKFLLGGSVIEARRGEVITSELTLMERWRWSKSKVRRFIKGLADERMVIKKADSKKTSILIINFETYQGNETAEEPQKDRRKTAKDTQSRRKEGKEGKDPSAISGEIASLVSKLFPSPGEKELFYQVGEAIASTRKTGKVSPNIILTQLKLWEKYPINQVHAGIQTYLKKACYAPENGRKDEAYLYGIIRNQPVKERYQEITPAGSGSDFYDKALSDYHSGKLKP